MQETTQNRDSHGQGSQSPDSQSSDSLNINKFLNLFGAIVVITCVFAGGFLIGKIWGGFGVGSTSSPLYKIVGDRTGSSRVADLDFNLFWKVWGELESKYVEKGLDQKEMYYGAIKGMVAGLKDPVTIFLTPDETKEYLKSNEGKFEGIGAELGYRNGALIVVTPLKGSPAIGAGIMAGDRILKVDGKDVADENIYSVVAKIRGKSGTKVTLSVIHRNQQKAVDITITRGVITVPSVSLEKIENGVAVVSVSRFTEASSSAWVNVWADVMKKVTQAKARAVVLDLRGNPGGYFSAGVWAAGEFLPKGKVVVSQRNREGQEIPYTVERQGSFQDIPLVVLVNGSSASASEILAGALQHYKRAYLIGEKTYGKGTAQEIVDFASDRSSLHLTTVKWILPDGKWLNTENVITPDKAVELSDEDFKKGNDTQLDAAFEYLKSK